MPSYGWGHTFAAGDELFSWGAYLPIAKAVNKRLVATDRFPLTEVEADWKGRKALTFAVTPEAMARYVWMRCVRSSNPSDPPRFAFIPREDGEPVPDYADLPSGWIQGTPGFAPADGQHVRVRAGVYYGPDHAQSFCSWADMRYIVGEVLKHDFVDATFELDDWTAIDVSDYITVITNDMQFPPLVFKTVGAFGFDPGVDLTWHAFTRKYERSIATTSGPGTEGDKVRFLVAGGTTPSGEFVNSCKVFARVSGAWVQQDPGTEPDVIDDPVWGNVGSFNARYDARGDIFGPHVLNELKLALAKMTRTIHGAEWYSGNWQDDTVIDPDTGDLLWHGSPNYKSVTSNVSRADAEDLWDDADAQHLPIFDEGGPRMWSRDYNLVPGFGGANQWTLEAWHGWPRTALISTHVTRTVKFFAMASEAYTGDPDDATYGVQFDTFGTAPLTYGEYTIEPGLDCRGHLVPVGSTSAATLDYIVGDKVGDVGTRPGWTAGPMGKPFRGFTASEGDGQIVALVDWTFDDDAG